MIYDISFALSCGNKAFLRRTLICSRQTLNGGADGNNPNANLVMIHKHMHVLLLRGMSTIPDGFHTLGMPFMQHQMIVEPIRPQNVMAAFCVVAKASYN
jgi:hypothetical protein